MENIKEAVAQGEGLLLHHWDTDGVSASALLLREFEGDITTFTPSIGNYLLDDDDRGLIEDIDPDFTVVVDMALPEDSIEFLKKFGKVYIFDHHLQERHDVELHHNPIIDGRSPKEYPSASWVVNDLVGNEANLLSILGACGDREEKLKENDRVYWMVENVLEEYGTDFDTLHECVELVDSCYKVGNREDITELPMFLRDIKELNDILEREDLQENVEKLKEAIEREVDGELEEVKDNVLLREMGSPYNIISTVTRRLAWAREDKVVVVTNCEYKDDDCQVYIRGPIPDSESIIEMVKNEGYSAGGKSDVVGMVIPEEEKEDLMDRILKKL